MWGVNVPPKIAMCPCCSQTGPFHRLTDGCCAVRRRSNSLPDHFLQQGQAPCRVGLIWHGKRFHFLDNGTSKCNHQDVDRWACCRASRRQVSPAQGRLLCRADAAGDRSWERDLKSQVEEVHVKMADVKKKAKAAGVGTANRDKKGLILAIQAAEGNPQCFGSGRSECVETKCCWRDDCLSM